MTDITSGQQLRTGDVISTTTCRATDTWVVVDSDEDHFSLRHADALDQPGSYERTPRVTFDFWLGYGFKYARDDSRKWCQEYGICVTEHFWREINVWREIKWSIVDHQWGVKNSNAPVDPALPVY